MLRVETKRIAIPRNVSLELRRNQVIIRGPLGMLTGYLPDGFTLHSNHWEKVPGRPCEPFRQKSRLTIKNGELVCVLRPRKTIQIITKVTKNLNKITSFVKLQVVPTRSLYWFRKSGTHPSVSPCSNLQRPSLKLLVFRVLLWEFLSLM